VLGDNVGYVIGRTVGRATLTRCGAKIGLTETRMSEIERIFLRYGSVTVLFARFFSILRQLNGIVAGMLKMPWWRFLLFNALGAALWVALWVFTAAYFSRYLAAIGQLTHQTGFLAAVLGIGALIVLLTLLVRRLRRGW
jgi:membrane protein DedA with SNARE-associated domain